MIPPNLKEEETMKKSIINISKTILAVIIYMVCLMVISPLLTSLFGLEQPMPQVTDQSKILTSLFTVGIIHTFVLIMLARRSRLQGMKLSLLLSSVYFTINHFLNVIESLVFLRNIYPAALQISETFNGLITSLILGFAISWLFSRNEADYEEASAFSWSVQIIPRWILWTVVWFIIYIMAGMLVPMSVEGFSDYYFSEQGAMDMSLVPVGYAMQIPRAAIWIIMTINLNRYLTGSSFERNLVIGVTYGAMMSSVLLIPNWIMPDLIRLAHLPEILFANILWGFFISGQVSRYFSRKEAPEGSPVMS